MTTDLEHLLWILARDWWLIVMRAFLALVLAVAAFGWPQVTVYILVALLAFYCLVDGAALVAVGWRHRDQQDRWWLVFVQGLVGLIAGTLILWFPDAGKIALLLLVAFWALVTGVLEITAAFYLRRLIEGEWLLMLAGVLSCLFGVLLIVFPEDGIVAYVWLVGLFSLIYGIAMAMLAARLYQYR